MAKALMSRGGPKGTIVLVLFVLLVSTGCAQAFAVAPGPTAVPGEHNLPTSDTQEVVPWLALSEKANGMMAMKGVDLAAEYALDVLGGPTAVTIKSVMDAGFDISDRAVDAHTNLKERDLVSISRDAQRLQELVHQGRDAASDAEIQRIRDRLWNIKGTSSREDRTWSSFVRNALLSPDGAYVVASYAATQVVLTKYFDKGVERRLNRFASAQWKQLVRRAHMSKALRDALTRALIKLRLKNLVRDAVKDSILAQLDEIYRDIIKELPQSAPAVQHTLEGDRVRLGLALRPEVMLQTLTRIPGVEVIHVAPSLISRDSNVRIIQIIGPSPGQPVAKAELRVPDHVIRQPDPVVRAARIEYQVTPTLRRDPPRPSPEPPTQHLHLPTGFGPSGFSW